MESDKVHACPAVAMMQQREVCTQQPNIPLATDTEDSDLED